MKTFSRFIKNESLFDTDDYDDEVRHVLTAPPNWLIRNGIVAIFLALMTLLVVSYFIKYPDTIKSTITITSYNNPVELKSRATGRIIFLAKQNTSVKNGTKLAYISNAADYQDLQILNDYLSSIAFLMKSYQIPKQEPPHLFNLGELEGSFSSLRGSMKEYSLFLALESYSRNVKSINSQIELNSAIEKQLLRQKALILEEVELANKKLKIDSILFKEKVISQLDFDNSLTVYLPFKKQAEQIDQNILSSKLRMAELESRSNDLHINYQETKNRLAGNLHSSFHNLVSELKIWEERYLITSPIDGKVSFFKFWSDNQNIEIGETLVTIIPESNNMFGQIMMPIHGSGKVKKGQAVNIRLDNYPSNEFGLLRGQVESISEIPQNDMYAVTVILSNGLITSHHKTLEFKEQMKGSSEIITNDLRLFERFFHQINRIFKNS